MPTENDSEITYTASFKSKSKATEKFPEKPCTKDLMLLSIEGNEKCEGKYLTAMVEQAVANHTPKAGFKYSRAVEKTTILIADEIYWHNLRQDPATDDEVLLKAKASAKGEAFFERNIDSFLAPFSMKSADFNKKYPNKTVDEKIQIINELAEIKGTNFEIIRWADWVKQKNFKQKLEKILPRYNEILVLKNSIVGTAESFVKRHTGQGTDDATLTLRSTGYLTEESPLMMLAAELGYNFIIYPGPMLPSFEATKDWFIGTKEKEITTESCTFTPKCAHTEELTVHVDNPDLVANWLQVYFYKKKPGSSRSNEIPAPLRTEEKNTHSLSFEPTESATTPTAMNEPVQPANQREAKDSTFFCSPKAPALTFFSPEKIRKVDIETSETSKALKVLADSILSSDLPLQQKGYLITQLYWNACAVSSEPKKPLMSAALS